MRLQRPLLGTCAVLTVGMAIGIAVAMRTDEVQAQATTLPGIGKPPAVCLAAGNRLQFEVTCPRDRNENSDCTVTATVVDSTTGMTVNTLSPGHIRVGETQDVSFGGGRLTLTRRNVTKDTPSPRPAAEVTGEVHFMVALEASGGGTGKKDCACGLTQLTVRPPGPEPKNAVPPVKQK